MNISIQHLETVRLAIRRRERKVEHITKLIKDFEAKVRENRELLALYSKERDHFTRLYDELRTMRGDRS
jgi:hypothetical protein